MAINMYSCTNQNLEIHTLSTFYHAIIHLYLSLKFEGPFVAIKSRTRFRVRISPGPSSFSLYEKTLLFVTPLIYNRLPSPGNGLCQMYSEVYSCTSYLTISISKLSIFNCLQQRWWVSPADFAWYWCISLRLAFCRH